MAKAEVIDLRPHRAVAHGTHLQVVQLMDIHVAAGGAGEAEQKITGNTALPGTGQRIERGNQGLEAAAAAGTPRHADHGLSGYARIDHDAVAMSGARRTAGDVRVDFRVQRAGTRQVAIRPGLGAAQGDGVAAKTGTAIASFGGVGEVAVFIQANAQPTTGKPRVTIVTLGIAQRATKAARLRRHAAVGEDHRNTIGTPAGAVGIGKVVELDGYQVARRRQQPLQGSRRSHVA